MNKDDYNPKFNMDEAGRIFGAIVIIGLCFILFTISPTIIGALLVLLLIGALFE